MTFVHLLVIYLAENLGFCKIHHRQLFNIYTLLLSTGFWFIWWSWHRSQKLIWIISKYQVIIQLYIQLQTNYISNYSHIYIYTNVNIMYSVTVILHKIMNSVRKTTLHHVLLLIFHLKTQLAFPNCFNCQSLYTMFQRQNCLSVKRMFSIFQLPKEELTNKKAANRHYCQHCQSQLFQMMCSETWDAQGLTPPYLCSLMWNSLVWLSGVQKHLD